MHLEFKQSSTRVISGWEVFNYTDPADSPLYHLNHLISLEITMSYSRPIHRHAEKFFKFLPRNLRKLVFIDRHARLDMEEIKYLPPRLDHFGLETFRTRTKQAWVGTLPKTLTRLNVSSVAVEGSDLVNLPPSLTAFWAPIFEVTLEHLRSLPSSVGRFSFSETNMYHTAKEYGWLSCNAICWLMNLYTPFYRLREDSSEGNLIEIEEHERVLVSNAPHYSTTATIAPHDLATMEGDSPFYPASDDGEGHDGDEIETESESESEISGWSNEEGSEDGEEESEKSDSEIEELSNSEEEEEESENDDKGDESDDDGVSNESEGDEEEEEEEVLDRVPPADFLKLNPEAVRRKKAHDDDYYVGFLTEVTDIDPRIPRRMERSAGQQK